MGSNLLAHFVLCFCATASNMVYTTIAPLFPLEVERRHLSSLYSGLVFWYCLSHFSAVSLGNCSALLFFKPLIRRWGRLGSVFSMLLILSSFAILFGLAKLFSSNAPFIALSLSSRLIQGVATEVTICSLILMASAYFRNFSSYLSVILLGIQLADLLGPLWGGLLFRLLGYVGIFMAQSVLMAAAALSILYFRRHEQAHPLVQIEEDDSLGYF